jgi:hypothetical protein
MLFRRSNYANSCEISLCQWICWIQSSHPVVPFLCRYFRACSEEKGETAIHTLMTHIREWNYSGENLKKRWLESSAVKTCFIALGVRGSHRTDGTKWYKLSENYDIFDKTSEIFSTICLDIKERRYIPLKPGTIFRRDAPTADYTPDCELFLNSLKEMKSKTSQHFLKLEKKFLSLLEKRLLLPLTQLCFSFEILSR